MHFIQVQLFTVRNAHTPNIFDCQFDWDNFYKTRCSEI